MQEANFMSKTWVDACFMRHPTHKTQNIYYNFSLFHFIWDVLLA